MRKHYHTSCSNYLDIILNNGGKVCTSFSGIVIERNAERYAPKWIERFYIDQGDTGKLFIQIIDQYGRTRHLYRVDEFNEADTPTDFITINI